MLIQIDDNCWVNPDHVEMIHKSANGPIVITLRSGRRFLVHDKELEDVLRTFSGRLP